MAADYKALCVELFGTEDENKIRSLAKSKAGRKKKFTTDDVNEMIRLRETGIGINEIAAKYNTSRQIVSKYINKKPAGCTMVMMYLYDKTPCTDIFVNFLDKKIQIKNYTADPLRRAFGLNEDPSWEDFEDFLSFRCFPKTRGNRKSLLKDMGLDSYDPLQIIEKTRGRITDDDMWIKVRYYGNKNN